MTMNVRIGAVSETFKISYYLVSKRVIRMVSHDLVRSLCMQWIIDVWIPIHKFASCNLGVQLVSKVMYVSKVTARVVFFVIARINKYLQKNL